MAKKKPEAKNPASVLAQPLPTTLVQIADGLKFAREELDPLADDIVAALSATTDLELMAILAFLKIKRPDTPLTVDKMKLIRDKLVSLISAGHLLVQNGDVEKYEGGARKVAANPTECWLIEKMLK